MGGVAGHMSHLYDNPSLTFTEMKEILDAASNGQLKAEEKVDGQNLFLSYSIPQGKAVGARNKGNVKDGGLDAGGLAAKFAGRGNIEKTFTKGFNAFSSAVATLSRPEKEKIFGPDADIWYNAEIMDPGTKDDPNDPGSTNVIKYDGKTLKIHDVGHFKYDKESGKQLPIPEGALSALDSVVGRMQKALRKEDYSLVRHAAIELNKLEDDEALQTATARINQAMGSEDIKDSDTLEEFMFRRIRNGIDGDLSEMKRDQLSKYLLKMEGNIGLRAIKKGLNPEDLQDINSIVNNKSMILLQAVEPIENAIHDFSVEILKGLESRFIIDSGAEVHRIQKELARAVRTITASGDEDPAAMEVMQRHLNKIKDFSNINTPAEGVVFVYNDHIYKFTGNFAPLNQILGMFRYPRGGKVRETTTESVIRKSSVILSEEEKITSEPSKAERFVLSLPKFTPTEAWGDPNSMERAQIQKIFDTVGGGATITEKLQFLNDSIENPRGGIRSPRRIISTLILLESIKAVIGSFSDAPAGFVFEGFMAGLLRGSQVTGRTSKGNLPIQDLIAFSEIEGGNSIPVSLKLLKGLAPGQKGKITNIEGSYTNLVDSLEEFGQMIYIIGRKDGEQIVLEKFTFTQDNFMRALVTGGRAGLVKEASLFQLPGKSIEDSIGFLENINDWETKYEYLQTTAGYDPKERSRKIAAKEKEAEAEEEVTVTDEVPDGEDIEIEAPEEMPGNRKMVNYSVEENRKLCNESLLLEGVGRQWSISPAQLQLIAPMVDYETLGSLPYSSDKITKVAEQYMKFLSDSLLGVFESTKNLSENITEYFTFRNRNKAMSSARGAINDSNNISSEMSEQLAQDQGPNENLVKEANYTPNIEMIGEASGKRITLFPGKFKPPHRGHYELLKKVANRPDVDEVVIMISPVSQPGVTTQQSLQVWSKYLELSDAPKNVSVEVSTYRSPVTSVYEYISDPTKSKSGDTILLLKSSKDIGDQRYKGAQSYAERSNPGIKVEEIEGDPITRPDGEPYNGGDAREAILQKNQKLFNTFMPSKADSDKIWNIFHPNTEFEEEVDGMIDEMSAMGLGNISGGGSGFGPPNNYDPYKSTQPKRPKLKRAKRQRRK